MARNRRTSSGRPRARRPARRAAAFALSPDVTRSIVAIVLMVIGAVLLIGLVLSGGGALTDGIRNVIAPWFGTGRWLLPVLLLGGGWYVEWGPGKRPGSGWGRTLLGLALAYVASLGLLAALVDAGLADGRSGGRIGSALADFLAGLLSLPGAIVVLVALIVVGFVVALDTGVRDLLGPFARAARSVGSAVAAPAADAVAGAAARLEPSPGDGTRDGATVRNGRGARETPRPAIPSPIPSPAVESSVFGGVAPAVPVPAAVIGTGAEAGPSADLAAVAVERRDRTDVTEAADIQPPRERREYRLPPTTLLEDIASRSTDTGMDHERNAAIIVGKLASFNIPARVTRWNAGPVVTQYEVEPDPSVKVSRIEGLADDLAMALAARTLRIEAPIPGKSVVGIEIPNMDFNVVAIRRILEDPEAWALSSKVAFALGRDVAGHPRAADLAKMPHLLIAGATGSGKSVMVNAVITSLLMRATPDEVRLILVDPKRVELADYNGIPHLLVPVVTEASRALAALKWAVGEMESRYRRFAGATARNIVAYNEMRADPADRLPFIVIIVDELADLMMRDGKTAEEPIVRLAQKARATGVHLVLATQRPSVNVVTGLIKANFPSRIAFAMASQIDSRTILDAPGAEDLIGRGDMLFQPSDLPRPIRLQGVFVSDREIRAVTAHWRAEAEPHYDLSIVETDEDGEGGLDDLLDADADRLLPDAVAVVQEYDRASASLLQRRLKIGYARAARIIDQLEARGFVGPFDGSNARQVLRRDAPSRGWGAPGPAEDDA